MPPPKGVRTRRGVERTVSNGSTPAPPSIVDVARAGGRCGRRTRRGRRAAPPRGAGAPGVAERGGAHVDRVAPRRPCSTRVRRQVPELGEGDRARARRAAAHPRTSTDSTNGPSVELVVRGERVGVDVEADVAKEFRATSSRDDARRATRREAAAWSLRAVAEERLAAVGRLRRDGDTAVGDAEGQQLGDATRRRSRRERSPVVRESAPRARR